MKKILCSTLLSKLEINSLIFLFVFLFTNALIAQKSLSLTGTSIVPAADYQPFGLDDFSIYSIDAKAVFDIAEQKQADNLNLHLEFSPSHNWEMVLEPSKVFADNFQYNLEDGTWINPKNKIKTYKGHLKNNPEISVRLTLAENFIHGIIYDDEVHSFEMVQEGETLTENTQILVLEGGQMENDAACGSHFDNENFQKVPTEISNVLPESGVVKMANSCVQLAITLDWQGYQNVANSSTTTFENYLAQMVNIVNGYYAQFSVEYEIAFIHYIYNSPNPWTDAPGNEPQLTQNFANWAFPNLSPNTYNCAMLFTGTNMNGIGYAFFGHMCPGDASRYSEIDYQYNQPLSHRANLMTHELGHLWDARHAANSSTLIMSPSIWDGNLNWDATAVNVITNAVNNVFASCLNTCGSIISTVDRGPYLQKLNPNNITIKWRTTNSTDSKVWYGSSPTNLTQTVTNAGSQTNHEVELNGLSANTKYYYAVGDNTGQMEGGDSDHYFITSPNSGSNDFIRAWVLGDAGTGTSEQAAVRDAYYNYVGAQSDTHTDMMLFLGDNAYQSGYQSEYQSKLFNIYDQKLINSVAWSCPGNHDYYNGSGLSADYYDIFTFPTNGESGGLASNTEKYYSFDYGNLHVISMDSEEESGSSSTMKTWLENDLAATLQEWIVVIFHHPPYSKGSHDSDTESRMINMRQNYLPICEDYGVDLVLSGHSHAYERSKLINGHYNVSSTYNPSIHNIDGGDGRLTGTGAYQQNVNEEGTVYIVTGSAGKTSSMSGTHPIMYYSQSELGSTVFEINGSQMDVKFLDDTGNVNDFLTILQNGSPTVNWTNPYNGEVFTNFNSIALNATASDSDGTITKVEFFVDNVLVGTDFSAPYSMNWTPSAYDNYTLKVTATDNDGNTNSSEISITVQDGSSIIISSQINSSSDDVEEEVSNGNMDVSSTDLEFVDESGSTPQLVGMRFNNITVPQGATITNAYVQFTVDETDSGSTNLTIRGQDHDNAATFSSSNSNVSTRTTTSASISWNPAAWNTVGAAGSAQQTPDLSNIIQEIIDRGGWAPNNSIALIVTGSGERTAESYDGSSSQAPTLHITYSLGTNCGAFVDNDNDGHCSDVDCDDNNAAVYPGAPELCDGLDNDCDGQIDEGAFNTYYADADGDGFGNNNITTTGCSAPAGYVSNNTDCDDNNVNVHPNATEICDGIDNNCDGQIDEGICGNTYCTPIHTGTENELITNVSVGTINNSSGGWNTNIIGYSDYTNLSSTLNIGTNYSITVSPNFSFPDSKLGIWADWNQNFVFDAGEEIASFSGEGPWTTVFALPANAVLGSTRLRIRLQYGAGWVPDPCAGTWYFSGETEDYTLIVAGCSTSTYYADSDGDGYGNANISTIGCSAPFGYVSNNTDCNDNNENVNPAATEVCDGIDNNCDGQIDEGLTNTYYADSDGDGYGNPNSSVAACSVPSGYVSNNIDCDDTNASIYPNALCDDGDPFTINDQYDANCICAGTPTTTNISSSISSSNDDVEQDVDDGDMDITSSDLELVEESGITPQIVGMRFNNINVPPGVTITNAYIQFTVDEADSGTTNLTVKGEASDNASAFSSSDYDVSDRATTNASVNWNPVAWSSVGAAGSAQQTPNLSSIIQEIISRSGWTYNSSIVLTVSGSGERTADSYDGSPSSAPTLHITYSPISACSLIGDADNDGYCTDVDCNDNDASIFPGAAEICDGIDNDCDGQIDEGNCIYCTPIHVGIENELITNVSVGSIFNNSGGWTTSTVGYSDYTNLSTDVAIGSNYFITVTSNYSWTDSRLGIWADWNQNYVFEAGEEIASLSGEGPWTVAFTPPVGASLGTTRLRIRLQYGAAYIPDPCDYSNFFSGETEDYNLEVLNASSCAIINDWGFESGWNIWNDGGSDARRNINDAAFANSGSFAIRLRDNTSTSVMTTDVLDLSSYSNLTVDFAYRVESFENTEDFWLQISINGGMSFTTVEDWVRTIDFENGERHYASVNIPGAFTNNCQLRFRCDASGNSDWVYIDDVVIRGCNGAGIMPLISSNGGNIPPTNPSDNTPASIGLQDDISEKPIVSLYPNPVNDLLTINYTTFDNKVIRLELFSTNGKMMLSQKVQVANGFNQFEMQMSALPNGVYYLRIFDGQEVLTKQVVVAR